MFELEWSRPSALLALALPLALWVLSRRPRPPRELATGTLAIWRALRPNGEPVGSARRRGVPWWVRWSMVALACGALALADPGFAAPPAPRWVVVLDRSPGVFLPWVGPDDVAAQDTRLDVALRGVDALVNGDGADEIEWRVFEDGAWRSHVGARPPASWTSAPLRVEAAPPWDEVDAAGVVFVSDRRVASAFASSVWSGGGPVDGLVGRRAGRALAWRDGRLVVRDEAAPLVVALDDEVPGALASLTTAWAKERGARVRSSLVSEDGDSVDAGADDAGTGGEPGDVLRVRVGRAPEGATAVLVDVGDASWRGAARRFPDDEDAARSFETLHVDRAGTPRVRARAGDVLLGLAEPFAIEGDRRAAGLAWIAVLEAAAPPPAGAVSLARRADAGEGGARLGAAPTAADPRSDRAPWAFWLLLGALAAGVLAARAGTRSRRTLRF